MKLGIIGFANIKYMPYLNFYLDTLKKDCLNDNLEIMIIEWNREGIFSPNYEKILGISKVYSFQVNQLDEVKKISKIFNFLAYRNFVKSILKRENFDKLIILHTFPGVLLFDQLMKQYKGKYIFDYRDFTYENIWIFKYIIGKIVRKSAMTFVSSEAFKLYLPDLKKIYTSHNIDINAIQYEGIRSLTDRNTKKIRISFWGFIRHEEINKKLISNLKNDNRFELHYYGREQKTAINLKKYCLEEGALNVFFHGAYDPIQKVEFAKNTELIHNVYDNETQMNLAVANKYYDGIVYSIPQLCLLGSYMGSKIKDKNIGLSITIDEYIGDNIYKYYENINWNVFERNTTHELTRIIKEYRDGQQSISNFVKGRN